MRSVAFLLPAIVAASVVNLSSSGFAGGPDPKQIQITSVSFSGNGCPQGSVSTSISPDKTDITFGFDRFQAYIGPDYPPTERTKNCQLYLNLRYPSGFQFAVVGSTYHGYLQLDEGITHTVLSTYSFSEDAPSTTTTRISIEGGGIWAQGQVYTKSDSIPTAAHVYSPCGADGILHINTRLSLTASHSRVVGKITDDDVGFMQQLNLNWRPCATLTGGLLGPKLTL